MRPHIRSGVGVWRLRALEYANPVFWQQLLIEIRKAYNILIFLVYLFLWTFVKFESTLCSDTRIPG